MPKQLAYVIITPYSLHKSRTGGILTRLITRTGWNWSPRACSRPAPNW